MTRSSHLAAWVLAAGSLALPQPRAVERTVAVTFDDLPAPPAGVVANDVASLREVTQRLLDAVRRHGIPAVGFVNEGKLFVEGTGPEAVERRTGLLRMWLDAGLELGNHSYSHRDLNQTPLAEFEADLIRGEKITRGLLEARGRTLRYFRHSLPPRRPRPPDASRV